MRQSLDLAREVLDHEIVDADGVSCGMVDDIEFDHPPGKPPVVSNLVVGPHAWSARTPALLSWLVRLVVHAPVVRVPWSEVEHVTERVQLRSTAAKLGLGKADRRVGKWVSRIPGA
ncbi:MAG TPA: hypothetical protein VFC24_04125 [Casimicrobiaceae bacterium]|nr:hypothetical protein [Casimicrobiaceae bacterium]